MAPGASKPSKLLPQHSVGPVSDSPSESPPSVPPSVPPSDSPSEPLVLPCVAVCPPLSSAPPEARPLHLPPPSHTSYHTPATAPLAPRPGGVGKVAEVAEAGKSGFSRLPARRENALWWPMAVCVARVWHECENGLVRSSSAQSRAAFRGEGSSGLCVGWLGRGL